ncbi:ATP-binding protein [Nocardioides panacisoli]|uniref:Histidine kinase/HSP90-like ATPase domain-containing protein n=1 Tax=Nocardioides panacisoli TaxID=627624 RepID=A0ABP7IVX4_9ACTN
MPVSPRPVSVGEPVASWAQDALRRGMALPAVHRVGLALVEGGGRRLKFTASDRLADGAPAWCHIDGYDDVPLNTAVRTGASVLGTVTGLHERYAAFAARQEGTSTVAVAAVPLVADAQTVGGYVLFFEQPQPLDDGQRGELEDLGRALGSTLRRAQAAVRRTTAGFAEDDVPPGAAVAVHEVTPDVAAVAPARAFLRSILGEWGVDEDCVYTAVLCLSELVTNAVIHTQTGCSVRVVLDRGVLLTSVRDLGAKEVAVEAVDDPLQPNGRGLQVLDALATRWGTTVDSDGTTVWFVLDLP